VFSIRLKIPTPPAVLAFSRPSALLKAAHFLDRLQDNSRDSAVGRLVGNELSFARAYVSLYGRKYGSGFSGWEDAIIGGWQTSFNMFAKTGTAFTPFWICNNCGPVALGNRGVSSVDAVGDFNGPSFRPVIIGDVNHGSGNQIWNPAAFDLPPTGADVLSNPNLAKRNSLIGPGTWGVNLGVHKDFHLGERVTATFGADVQNIFNHFLYSPNADDGGGGGSFANLGYFDIAVDPATLKPIIAGFKTNDDFGRLIQTYTQESVDSRRTIRLRLRITF